MRFDQTLSLLALLAGPAFGASSITYCSSVNTGASFSANVSIYQSNGLCEQTCNADYAFGILQGENCWCSNIAPNKTTNTNTSDCDVGCPGFPSDSCGDASKSLFAYLQMSEHAPSGTATASSTQSTTGTVSSNTATTGQTTASANTEVVTSGGQVKTITVDSTPTSASAASSGDNKAKSSVSGGTIAGAVVGSIGGLAVIIALIFCVLAKRRSRAESPDPSVHTAFMDGRQSKSSQMSFGKGMFSDNHSHTLSAGSSVTAQRLPTFTDNRLKTDTVLYGGGGRRDSITSLQDNEDYSRPVLRLTNPD